MNNPDTIGLSSFPANTTYEPVNNGERSHSQDSLRPDEQRTHQQSPEKVDAPTFVKRRRNSWSRKLGITVILVIILGNLAIAVCFALLAFLWFADNKNAVWHEIVSRDWVPKAVTIISEVLKIAVGFQIGTCSAMLAALALEQCDVELGNVASVALTKTTVLGSGAVIDLFWEYGWLWRLLRRGRFVLPLFVTAFLLIFGFLQAVTVILVSDLGLENIPANSITVSKPLDIQVGSNGLIPTTSRSSPWETKPYLYPTFAEYSEEPYIADGVDDTGVSLRALLPFAAVGDRQTLQESSGKTAVLDTRVTCQVPTLSLEFVQAESTSGMLKLNGTVSASRLTPRLGNFTAQMVVVSSSEHHYEYNSPIPFTCFAPSTAVDEPNPPWRMTLCQLGNGAGDVARVTGGLVSEFRDLNSLPTTGVSAEFLGVGSWQLGTAYLVLNVTLGDMNTWRAVTPSPSRPPAVTQHGTWLDLVYSNSDLILSVSLCYSGFDVASIPVHIASDKNRTEPAVTYDLTNKEYGFNAIRRQLGQNKTMRNDERGVLDLRPQRGNWLAAEGEQVQTEPWIRQKASIRASTSGAYPDVTAIMWTSGSGDSPLTGNGSYMTPDPMHISFFQEVVKSSGSIAFGLQSLLTVMSGMAYYDQLAEFNSIGDVKQTFFVTTNIARSSAGFGAVVAVVGIHFILSLTVTWLFLVQTRYSLLGSVWHAVAQLYDSQVIDFYDVASNMKDFEVQKYLLSRGRSQTRTGVSVLGDGESTGLVQIR